MKKQELIKKIANTIVESNKMNNYYIIGIDRGKDINISHEMELKEYYRAKKIGQFLSDELVKLSRSGK